MSTASYTYVAEISTPENRGILQALGPICASFGILLTYILGYYMSWSFVAFLSISFSLFTIVSIQFIPESPAYLMQTGNPNKSFESYFWLRRNIGMAQHEVSKHTIGNQNIEKRSAREVWCSAATVKPFLIIVTLFFLQELSGIYTVLYYAVEFFEQTDLTINSYVCSIVIGAIRFAMSIVTAFLINKFGRKILCISSSAGMAIAMLIMVVFFKYYETYPNEAKIFPILPLICVVINVMFSMVGMLPIPWILVGEIFPLEVRSIISGVVICIAQCFVFLFVKIYPNMLELLNFSGTLATFLAASVVAVFFCRYILPETKDRSLQEIEDYFQNKIQSDDCEKKGYDNKGFILRPETFNRKSEGIFTMRIS